MAKCNGKMEKCERGQTEIYSTEKRDFQIDPRKNSFRKFGNFVQSFNLRKFF